MGNVLRYELIGLDLDAHEYQMRLTVPQPAGHSQRLSMAAWIPGSYMIRDFARNITAISARDERGPLPIRKLDKQTWEVADCQGELVVDYSVYAFDLSVRGAYLDRTRAFFNGTGLFLCVPDRIGAAWELHVPPPAHPCALDWRLATTLDANHVDERGFGLYAGTGYSRLIDSPVEIGAFSRKEFAVDGIPHEFVVSDGGRFDFARLCHDLAIICSEHVAMFGELPVTRYLFLTLATADGYGGLEHGDSTSLICKRSDLPVPGMDKPDKGYRQLLGLCSHEYFHLWNVKRIRPAALAAADLSKEVHTELLWAFEGITSYYDDLALVRSGVLAIEGYLDLLGATVSRVLRTPGRARQSVAESSFDAWTKFYKQDENAPNAIVSYYAKGALVAFGLDVVLRESSGGDLSLDDLMRRLWQRYGKTGLGVAERALEREASDLLGASLDEFFDHYVYGTMELPLETWFGKLGIGYRVRAANAPDDLGGHQPNPPGEPPPPSMGARFEMEPAGLRLTHVFAGGAAHQAGLAAGDLLVAVDGERVNASNIADLLRRIGDTAAEAHFFRRDRIAITMFQNRPPANDTCDLWLLPDEAASADALVRRAAWLQSNRVLTA